MKKKAVLVLLALLLMVTLVVGCTTGSAGVNSIGVITHAPTPPSTSLVEEGVTPEPNETQPAIIITPMPVPASEPNK